MNTRNREEIPPQEIPAGSGRRGGGGPGASEPAFQLIVTDLEADSPAAIAGLRAGDRIITVDGTPATARLLNDAINSRKPGERIHLRVSRNAAELDIDVEVARNAKKTLPPVGGERSRGGPN